jgi:hypothetical protein
MTTVTNYLKLRNIQLQSTQWFTDYNFNISRLDSIGKHLRMQTGAGQTMALRTELADGTLAEAIRIIPEGDSIAVYLGRTGRGDKVVIAATALYSSISLSNQRSGFTSYKMDIGAQWSDEDVGGDDIQNTTFIFNPRNNDVSIMEVPAASVDAGVVDQGWVGSAAQLELSNDTLVGSNRALLKFTVSTKAGGSKTYVLPCYRLT